MSTSDLSASAAVLGIFDLDQVVHVGVPTVIVTDHHHQDAVVVVLTGSVGPPRHPVSSFDPVPACVSVHVAPRI
jgi:hypothetical protein